MIKDKILILYISFILIDVETRYHTTKKECLVVLRYLEEVR